MAYATGEQLGSYLEGGNAAVPSDAARLLDRASELVDDHVVTAVYDVDEQDMPTDPKVIAALADAVCAQVEYWLTGDEEDDILGPLESTSIGGMSQAHGSGQNRVTPMYLAPRAARHLRKAGLLSAYVGS